MSEKFVRIEERLNSLIPSACWFTEHPTLTFNLIALALGTVILSVAVYGRLQLEAWGFIDADQTPLPKVFQYSIVKHAFVWGAYWFAGIFFAHHLQDWLVQAWPNIELDTGPEHIKWLKIKRRRIGAFFTMVVAPLCVRVVYDAGKAFRIW